MDQTLLSSGAVEVYRFPRHIRDWRQPRYRVAGGTNALLFSGVDVMARALAEGARLDGMYLEYVNTANPGALTPPTIDVLAGVEYYTGLTGDRDYLRVPLRLDGGFEAADSRYRGNRARFIGVSGGAAGVHGLPFGGTAGSAVCGMALAVTGKTAADDMVYARYYLAQADAVGDNQAIGAAWTLTLKHPQH